MAAGLVADAGDGAATPAARRLQLFGAVSGILGFFLAYGYLQEKIMVSRYGEDRAQFRDSGLCPTVSGPVTLVSIG